MGDNKWLTRNGMGRRFGSVPVGRYQQHQYAALDYITAVARANACDPTRGSMSMARVCNCHKNFSMAMASGVTFDAAYRKHHRPGYHEHRCDCACGCTRDTCGYALCVPCSFGDCKAKHGKRYRWES